MFHLEQAQQRRPNATRASQYQACEEQMRSLLASVQQGKQQLGSSGLSWPPRSEAGTAAAGMNSGGTDSYLCTTYGAGAKAEPAAAAAASGDADGGWGDE